jgi:GMP synthase (glutamine-hydrolysing)
LLAHAAGARVYPMREAPPASRRYEVGWGSISLHHAGSEALLRGLPAEAPVLHWHGDTFDLPPNAKLLASSKLCQSQAFCLGTRLFGLQFHCEVELAQIDAFLAADGDFVTRANGADGVDRIRDATRVHYEEARRFGDRLLGNLLDAMTEAAPRR